ncbi:MAG: PQQ-binding-like beta-propeller repeat protein [Dehalococcoidia bacterium]
MAKPDGWAAVAQDERAIYVFPNKDKLEARDPGTGQVFWVFPDKNKPDQKKVGFEAVYDDPILADGSLYFGSHDGKLIALNANDGSLRWLKDDISGGITGGPLLVDGLLVFGTDTGRIYARKATDGSTAAGWPVSGVKAGEQVWAPPVPAGSGRVAIATMDGVVRAYSLADASEVWAAPFEADGAVADLGVAGAEIFVPSLGKEAIFLDPASGRSAGSFATSDWLWSNPAVASGVGYFGDFGGKVYAVDLASRRMLWAAAYDAEAKIKSAPVVIGDVLIVASREPAVHFISIKDGSRLNVVPIDSGTVRAPLTVRDGKALLVTTKGTVFVADPVTRSVALAPGERN